MAHSTPYSPHSDPVCDPRLSAAPETPIQTSRWPLQSGPWCYLLITTCHPSTGKPLRKKGLADKPLSVSSSRNEIRWLLSRDESCVFHVKRICHLSMSNVGKIRPFLQIYRSKQMCNCWLLTSSVQMREQTNKVCMSCSTLKGFKYSALHFHKHMWRRRVWCFFVFCCYWYVMSDLTTRIKGAIIKVFKTNK